MFETIRIHTDGRRPEALTFTGATVIILIGCAVPFWLPLAPASMALVAGVAGSQVLAYMAYFRFRIATPGDSEETGRRDSRLLYALPVVGAVCAFPAIVAGRVDLDVDGVFELVLIMLLLGGAAIPLAMLCLALVWAPVELLVRGVLRLLRGGRDGLGYMAVATLIGAFTASAVVGTLAVDSSYSPGQRPRYQSDAIPAVLGIPGDYTVADPTLLLVARVLVAFLVLVLVTSIVAAIWDKVRSVRRIGTKGSKSEAPASGSDHPEGRGQTPPHH